jgi:hypothetical protein
MESDDFEQPVPDTIEIAWNGQVFVFHVFDSVAYLHRFDLQMFGEKNLLELSSALTST